MSLQMSFDDELIREVLVYTFQRYLTRIRAKRGSVGSGCPNKLEYDRRVCVVTVSRIRF